VRRLTGRGPKAVVSSLYRDSLARASSIIVTTTGITAILGFAYWVAAARMYPSAAVGTAAVSISAMGLGSLLSSFGASSAAVQRLPHRRAGGEWSATTTVALAVVGLAGLVAGLASWWVITSVLHTSVLRSPEYGVALALGVALTNMSSVLDAIWIVERQAETQLLTNTVMSLAKLGLLSLPVFRVGGAAGIQWSWTASVAVAIALSMTLFARRHGYRPTLAKGSKEIKVMRHAMVGNYIVAVGASTPTYSVPVLVGTMVSLSQTAYFYSAWRVGSFFFVGSMAVSQALFAEGSRNPRGAIHRARQALLVVEPLILVGTVALLLLGRSILAAFGAQYEAHAVPLLLLLVLTAMPDVVNTTYLTLLRLERRFVQASCFMYGLAVLQITLTWLLVSRWGITGAGAAWLFSEYTGVLAAVLDGMWHPGLFSRSAMLARSSILSQASQSARPAVANPGKRSP
jgi:O-antigen/teichoic acid export membrane protein